jgi:hypothetical protein
MHLEGGCHCRNVTYVFETTADIGTLGLRACQCSFCRSHGARTTSDPNGAVRIGVKDPGRLNRYRFGLRTADFLVCRECGSFVGAVMEDGGGTWMTVNANTLLPPPGADIAMVPHDFGAEDKAGRIARRKARWTPVKEFRT